MDSCDGGVTVGTLASLLGVTTVGFGVTGRGTLRAVAGGVSVFVVVVMVGTLRSGAGRDCR